MLKTRQLAVLAGFVALASAAPLARAAPCAGFADIDDTDPFTGPFCSDVQWIRNRGVTLGCGDGSNYCPTTDVTRLQMAAFMRRLGDALTPTILTQTALTGAIDLDLLESDTNSHLCKVGPVAAAIYPRRAIVYAQLSGLAAGALQVFGATSASVDGAAFARTAPGGIGMRAHAAGTVWTNVTQTASVDMDAGKTYAFAFFVQRAVEDSGVPNPPNPNIFHDFTEARCNMTVSIGSRTGTSSPFDAAAGPADNTN